MVSVWSEKRPTSCIRCKKHIFQLALNQVVTNLPQHTNLLLKLGDFSVTSGASLKNRTWNRLKNCCDRFLYQNCLAKGLWIVKNIAINSRKKKKTQRKWELFSFYSPLKFTKCDFTNILKDCKSCFKKDKENWFDQNRLFLKCFVIARFFDLFSLKNCLAMTDKRAPMLVKDGLFVANPI